MNDYATPFDVYADKLGLSEDVENDYMEWGRRLEPVVLQAFSEKAGLSVRAPSAVLRSKQWPWMMANLDGAVLSSTGQWTAVVECKTSARGHGWQDGQVPDHAHIQLMHQLAVTGLAKGYVATLISGHEFRYHEFERDETIIEMLVEAEREFWECVKNQTPPELTLSSKNVLTLYPRAEDDTVVLPGGLAPTCGYVLRLKELKKRVEEELEIQESAIKQELGKYGRGVVGDYQLAWPNVTTTTLDTDRLKKERPDIYKEFARSKTTRRFTLKETGDGKEQRRVEGESFGAAFRRLTEYSQRFNLVREITAPRDARSPACGAPEVVGDSARDLRLLGDNSTPE